MKMTQNKINHNVLLVIGAITAAIINPSLIAAMWESKIYQTIEIFNSKR